MLIMFKMKETKIEKYNMNVKLYGMIFKLDSIRIYGDLIRISATTSNDNYCSISNIIETINHINKIDITISKQLKIINIFPIDINFNTHKTIVLLSADYIVGDIEKGLIQYERKEKIKKINRI